MGIKAKIIASIVVIGIVAFASMFIWSIMEPISYTYYGQEEFETMEEMQEFQSDLVNKSQELDASVMSFDLTVMSPPKVTFAVRSRLNTFPYGSLSSHLWILKVFQIGGALCALVATFLTLWNIWKE